MRRIDSLRVQIVITDYDDTGRPIGETCQPVRTVFIASTSLAEIFEDITKANALFAAQPATDTPT